jgi:hypothetical protein
VNIAVEAEPIEVRTVMTPDVAPVGTTATSWVPLLEFTVAGLPLNLTLAPVRFAPFKVTSAPTAPDKDEILAIRGGIFTG